METFFRLRCRHTGGRIASAIQGEAWQHWPPPCRSFPKLKLQKVTVRFERRLIYVCFRLLYTNIIVNTDNEARIMPEANPGAVYRNSTVCSPAGSPKERNALRQIPGSARSPSI